ncbi:kinesin-like protein KIF27 isoform X3 [Mercenaria mercenaria]|uniref:kinesin-like protein KIF27 isoform X3 n=1 Tax=Mercenaria mercenaria TaxID=6596 RepID=UPI00234F89B9|nr:kinesin-like protein KIF27 isoform X3 [Mercenaria mercenaria]
MEGKEKTMQEVNVRVAVRVRPMLPKEKVGGDEMCVKIIPTTKQLILGKDRGFTFDEVLSPKATQEELYTLCVENLVKSIFEGYNATVFAYGQTGSGKTYTIGGGNISPVTEDEDGIIPRAVRQMFDTLSIDKSVNYTVKVSYIEIYKEELRDLLELNVDNKPDLHVREDDKGNTVIIGAREVECESLDEVMSLLETGSAARHTGATNMNEHSSRSHSIFTITIGQMWTENDVLASKRKPDDDTDIIDDEMIYSTDIDKEMTHNMFGKFHFVDLAGSERAHKTGNVGDRFKESVHINSGLLALGNVISALGDPKKKSTHIPYRESKITRLLKDSLGGNAKTLMICCVSPSAANFDESLNALKYANRARNIRNLPIVNRDIQSIRFEEMQTEIKALREELARQRTTVTRGNTGWENDPDLAAKYVSQIKHLEDQVARLQTECGNYKMIAEEAYRQFLQIQGKDILTQSQDGRLRDWLDLMEEHMDTSQLHGSVEIKCKVPQKLNKEEWESQTVKDLQKELKKAKEDLKSDEDIFAEKAREVIALKARLEEMESLLEQREKTLVEGDEKLQQQEQQLIEQNMKIEELQKALKETALTTRTVDTQFTQVTLIGDSTNLSEGQVTASAPVTSRQASRPKSVPIHLHKHSDMRYSQLRPPSRNIKTSPALFTLERVMKSFRARSQLLVSRLEDGDEVLHLDFSDGEDNAQNVDSDGDEMSREGTFVRKGTFRIKKGKSEENKENAIPEIRVGNEDGDKQQLSVHTGDGNVEVGRSQEVQKKIKQAQLKMLESNKKIRDLAINIKLKEQLIRELVKTGKDAEQMNKQYAGKIAALEKEKEVVKQELSETQKMLAGIETKEHQETVEKEKLLSEYKKKVEAAKAKMTVLQRKQKETEKVASISNQNDKKISDLELAVDRMKQQQENLQKRLKEESDRKVKLEREMQKELQRVTELEIKNEQQQKLLKRKNEEIASAKRRLRNGSAGTLPPINGEEHDKIEEQKRWLDSEIEKMVQQRQEVEHLQEELRKREEMISRKEALLSERSELEMKKLRSSQVVNKSLLSVSSKLDMVERKLEEKSRELAQTPDLRAEPLKEDIEKLCQTRDKLQKQRALLDEKLHGGSLLSGNEERRLIELDEGIEALDAAIEYRSETIRSKQLEVRHSQALAQSEDNFVNRMNSLSAQDLKTLLAKYFEKVVNLREQERKFSLHSSEMEVKIDEQERLIRELEGTLQRSAVEIDRRLMAQQKEYEQKIQLLMHQLMENGGNSNNNVINGHDPAIEQRVTQLEKDLYYYKKTSRELKKRLREYVSSGTIPAQEMDLRASVQSSLGDAGDNQNNNHGNSHSQNRESHSARSRDHRTAVDRLRDDGGRLERSKEDGNRPSSGKIGHHLSSNVTPVKISRKDLRLMSEEEIKMRRSNLKDSHAEQQSPHDSLDPGGKNPWG